ncbi:MAG: hypothetical protein H7Y18_03995 [Clostridiaceae bacterium]|nr:hypothetical protein [Clostridiaceae bacterium]
MILIIDIQEYRKSLDCKTGNTKDLAKMLGVSEAKARRITHSEKVLQEARQKT